MPLSQAHKRVACGSVCWKRANERECGVSAPQSRHCPPAGCVPGDNSWERLMYQPRKGSGDSHHGIVSFEILLSFFFF